MPGRSILLSRRGPAPLRMRSGLARELQIDLEIQKTMKGDGQDRTRFYPNLDPCTLLPAMHRFF